MSKKLDDKIKKYGQTKKHSKLEALFNVGSGMLIAWSISQLLVFLGPEIRLYIWDGFDYQLSMSSNFVVTVLLTFVSMARGYVWRRLFNKLHLQNLEKKLEK